MIEEIAFLDFENIQYVPAGKLTGKMKLMMIVGNSHSQSKTAIAYSQKAIDSAASIEIVKVRGQAPNALDFHIAYYLGKEISQNTSTKYSIYSNDKGYDPLISHLQAEGVKIARFALADAEESKKQKTTTAKPKKETTRKTINEMYEKAEKVLASTPKKNRPKKIKEFRAFIKTALGNKNTNEEIENVCSIFMKKGSVALDGEKLLFAD